MGPNRSVELECPRAGVGGRARLYRSLARLLPLHPGSGGLLVEAGTDLAEPRLIVRPDSVAAVARADRALDDLAIAVRPARAAPAVPGRSGGRFDLVVADRPPDPGGAPAAEARVRELVGPGGWLGVQTFVAADRRGGLWTARRAWCSAPTSATALAWPAPVRSAVAAAWSAALRRPVFARRARPGAGSAWRSGSGRTLPRAAWTPIDPTLVERVVEPPDVLAPPGPEGADGHDLVLGASGAGKTRWLARSAAAAILRGTAVLVIDLHGDLAPAVAARLPGRARGALVCLEPGEGASAGIAALVPGDRSEPAAAHLVAALKRLSPDGADVYWGFRLERLFDAFVRLAQEGEGSLLDLYHLLTDADRREAARASTADADLARLLDEIGPITRRTPDFLWGAAARLSKVVRVPALAELLAPADGGLPVERLLREGRSILLRIPFGRFGPEAATFAGSLVLARVYLGLASCGPRPVAAAARIRVVLDEVQGFSPRLVAEMLAEGRKFGLDVQAATQYPDRMAPELRLAAGGVVRRLVVFRVPPAAASFVGGWIGLAPSDAQRLLPELPTGHGFQWSADRGGLERVSLGPEDGVEDPGVWPHAVAATGREFPAPPAPGAERPEVDEATDRLLVSVLAAEEAGGPLARAELAAAVGAGPERFDPALLDGLADRARRTGYVAVDADGRFRLTPAGERRLGLGAPTGATRETPQHRALLFAAVRVFARRGCRLEIVRQGRWDTTLPDALYRQLPERLRRGPPTDLAAALERARGGWAWRAFGGRDVHVEAEVSGALRRERIAHGVRKGLRRGAFVLFLVGDAHRARRVRTVLSDLGVGRDRAQVWTLQTGARGAGPAASTPKS